jgi:hypothetical protein
MVEAQALNLKLDPKHKNISIRDNCIIGPCGMS